MIFIVKGGTSKRRNAVISAIASLADTPVYRRSIMNVPLLILRKSTSVRAQAIVEIFKSYVGDILDIRVDNDTIDRRVPNPGDDSNNDTYHYSDVVNDVKKIASSLTTGVDPLFLFNLVLKNVGRFNKRHHVFVDLQYKEELDLLNKKNEDPRIVITLEEETPKDDLLPEIESLTPLEESDFTGFVTISIPKNANEEKIIDTIINSEVFDKDSKKSSDKVVNTHGGGPAVINGRMVITDEPPDQQEEAVRFEEHAEEPVD